MNVTLLQTGKLMAEDHAFKSLGFSMLLTNLKTFHKMTSLKYSLEDCNSEINKFLNKFKAVMAEDFEIIARL